jgi:hypothetical protein
MIGVQQYREMENSSARAPPAREPVNIEAAGIVAERETNASNQLMALEARRERETNAPCPREMSMSKGDGKSTCRRERLPPSGEMVSC